MQRTAKVFMNNRNQAVRLPKEFQFSTSEVYIRKEGDNVVLSPRPTDWSGFLASERVASVNSWRDRRFAGTGARDLVPRYMLDTDISSYIMKRTYAQVLERLQRTRSRTSASQ